MNLMRLNIVLGLSLITLGIGGVTEVKAGGISVLNLPHLPSILALPREIPCNQALKPYFDWASGTTPGREDRRGVEFTLIYNQNRNPNQAAIDSHQNVVGYTAAGLSFQGGVLQGDGTASFSDRMFCPSPSGGFCFASAPFNPNAVDKQGITLSEEGALTTVLKSWGNGVYKSQLICMDNGVFYSPSEASQKNIAVVTLQKTGFVNPR